MSRDDENSSLNRSADRDIISQTREILTWPRSRLLDTSKVLANRARLRTLATLEGNELCVGQVAAIFDIARSTASEHISALRRVGFVGERRDGRFVYCSLAVDEHARKFSDVVLAELSADAAVRKDRDLTARILALPHDLVCEQGRPAMNAPISPVASPAPPTGAARARPRSPSSARG